MKTPISFLLTFLLSLQSMAGIPTQRTIDSSFAEYNKYLVSQGRSSFVDAYIHLSSVTELQTPLLEQCLEELYLGAPSDETCLSAVKSLTSKPLNQMRRDILWSFLTKLEKSKTPHKSFYSELKSGLLWTHPKIAQTFNSNERSKDQSPGLSQELEMRAWKKALSKKFPLEEVALLINGKKVAKLESWTAPKGIYQWSLISNTHEPIVRLGTFSQFSAEAIQKLKPLAEANCERLPTIEVQKFGFLHLEIFSSPKCIAQFGHRPVVAQNSSHLSPASSMVNMQPSGHRHWVWPALMIVGFGVAAGLRNKKVSIEMPSFR